MPVLTKKSLFPWRSSLKKGVIGFDLASESLHMLQFEKRNGQCLIRAAGTYSYNANREELLSNADHFRSLVRLALKSRPFSGKKVVTYLPSGETKLINMNYEVPTGQLEEEVIVRGVLERFGGDIENYIIDFMPIRRKDPQARERKALVAVAKREEVLSFLKLFSDAGLDVEAIEVGPAALRRLIRSLGMKQKHQGLMLINFGRIGSYITVLSGRRLLMDREMPLGEIHFIGRLQNILDISEREALSLISCYGVSGNGIAVESEDCENVSQAICQILKPLFLSIAGEINKVLLYMASETRGKGVEKVHVFGSIARYPGIEKILGEILSIPVLALDPLAHFPKATPNAIPPGLDPVVSMAMAAGLALRGV